MYAVVGAVGHGIIRLTNRKTGEMIAEYVVNDIMVFDMIYKGDIEIITSDDVKPIIVPWVVYNVG